MFRNTHPSAGITFAWILSAFTAHIAFAAPWCDTTFDLEPNTVWRGSAHLEEHTFRWLLPSPGIATVDLLNDGVGSGWVDLRAGGCGEQAAEALIIEQSSSHLVLAVRSAGYLYLGTGIEASPFRLITSFTKAEVAEETLGRGGPGIPVVQTSFLTLAQPLTRKTEAEIADPDPGGHHEGTSRLGMSVLTLAPWPTQKTEAEIADPDPGGVQANSVGRIRPALAHTIRFEPVCRRTEVDDHGDTPTCSTDLAFGRSVMGELANDWNDDRDIFSFHVALVSKVEIVLVTEAPGLTYELLGPAGQRLAVDSLRANDGEGMRLVSALAPGRYFFRVAGTSGAYALNLTADH